MMCASPIGCSPSPVSFLFPSNKLLTIHDIIELYRYDPLEVYNHVDTFEDILRVNVAYLRGELYHTYYTMSPVDQYIKYPSTIQTLVQLHKYGVYVAGYSHARLSEDVLAKNVLIGFCPSSVFSMLYNQISSSSSGIIAYGRLSERITCCNYTLSNKIPLTYNARHPAVPVVEWDITQNHAYQTCHMYLDDILLQPEMVQFCFTTEQVMLSQPTYVEDTLLQLVSRESQPQYIVD